MHTSARHFRDTDWAALTTLYDQLYALQPSPVVALNMAVVTAEVDGPKAALAAIEARSPGWWSGPRQRGDAAPAQLPPPVTC